MPSRSRRRGSSPYRSTAPRPADGLARPRTVLGRVLSRPRKVLIRSEARALLPGLVDAALGSKHLALVLPKVREETGVRIQRRYSAVEAIDLGEPILTPSLEEAINLRGARWNLAVRKQGAGTPQDGLEFDEADLSKSRLNARCDLAAPVGEELRVTAVTDFAHVYEHHGHLMLRPAQPKPRRRRLRSDGPSVGESPDRFDGISCDRWKSYTSSAPVPSVGATREEPRVGAQRAPGRPVPSGRTRPRTGGDRASPSAGGGAVLTYGDDPRRRDREGIARFWDAF